MIPLPDIKKIKVSIDKIENDFIKEKKVSLSILRLDNIDPEISGNKFFKLYYFLKKAIGNQKMIITFGGAYSNHLAATAKACKMFQLSCIGIVRGEEINELSPTLLFCKRQGMELTFISREEYRKKDDKDFKRKLTATFGEHILIPEGGYSRSGLDGAALISNFYRDKDFTHICCSAGTATTCAGLIKASKPSETILCFSALKGITSFEARIRFLNQKLIMKKYFLMNEYHFGGYAKKTPELISFMNNFYKEFSIPTDFIYTGKMMFGIIDLINKSYFPEGSQILSVHTGGLQGNISLPPGTLNF